MKLSIIVVNYNTYSLTKDTIEAVLKNKYSFEYEIILVDNASIDGSIEQLEEKFQYEHRVHIIKNIVNLGFAKGNNMGIKRSRGEYILLLNSDTRVQGSCIQQCMDQIEKGEHIGALGCKVLLASGALDQACKRGFPTPLASLCYFLGLDKWNHKRFGKYHALTLGEDEVGEVDALTGAFMLMPRKVLDEVGFLDEDFFMYGEDIDLCYRIKEAGYKVIYYPKAKMIHYKGASSTKKRCKVIFDFHHAMWIFYKKHYESKNNIIVNFIVIVAIILKCILALGLNLVKQRSTKTPKHMMHMARN